MGAMVLGVEVQGFTRESIGAMAANANRVLQTLGNKVAVYTGEDVTLKMQPSGQTLVLSAGVVVEVQPFNRVEIVNGSSIQDVVVYAGAGDYNDGRATLSATITASIETSDVFTQKAKISCPAGATTLISTGSATKKSVLIRTLSTALGNVFLGSVTTTVDEGTPVEPGDFVEILTEAAIYAYNGTASAIDVYVSETSA